MPLYGAFLLWYHRGMSTNEIPPKEENLEQTLEVAPTEIEAETQQEVPLVVPETKESREEAINKKYEEIIATKPTGEELLQGESATFKTAETPLKKENWMSSKWRKAMTLLGFAGALALPHKSEGKTAEDTLTKRDTIERTISGGEDSTKKKSNVKVYTASKTKEGGITPTGLSNSFLENPYGVTEADISAVAEKYGFSTESNAAFQKDMYNYLKENKPELIQEILEKYGQTQKGGSIDKNASLEEQIKGLIDGNLGVRDAFTIAQLKKVFEEIQKIEKVSPQETIREIPQPTGKYVINVRGDEPGSRGVYYFFDNEAEFMEATDAVGHYLSREVKKGEGQATINMNADVFLKRYAKGKEDLLGTAWERNGKDQYKFFVKETKNTTANYADGFVKAQ